MDGRHIAAYTISCLDVSAISAPTQRPRREGPCAARLIWLQIKAVKAISMYHVRKEFAGGTQACVYAAGGISLEPHGEEDAQFSCVG